jgi:hypothetical protein
MTLGARSLILLVGIIVLVLAAFGVDLLDDADEAILGIAICFAAFLVG